MFRNLKLYYGAHLSSSTLITVDQQGSLKVWCTPRLGTSCTQPPRLNMCLTITLVRYTGVRLTWDGLQDIHMWSTGLWPTVPPASL